MFVNLKDGSWISRKIPRMCEIFERPGKEMLVIEVEGKSRKPLQQAVALSLRSVCRISEAMRDVLS